MLPAYETSGNHGFKGRAPEEKNAKGLAQTGRQAPRNRGADEVGGLDMDDFAQNHILYM
jgi:hypothetical protein